MIILTQRQLCAFCPPEFHILLPLPLAHQENNLLQAAGYPPFLKIESLRQILQQFSPSRGLLTPVHPIRGSYRADDINTPPARPFLHITGWLILS